MSFILSFFLLLGSLVPCSDGAMEQHSSEPTKAVAQLEHDHQRDCQDTRQCAPLCVCHCCQMHYVSSGLSLAGEVHKSSSPIAYMHPSFHSKEQHTIWRPPLA